MQRSTLRSGGPETFFSVEEILERMRMADSSIKQQVHSLQTNRNYPENEQNNIQAQDGVFLPLSLSEPQNPEHPDIDPLSFDIPESEVLTSLFTEYKDTMNFIRRLIPGSSPRSKPQPRELSRHSRLIDGWIEIEKDPASQGSFLTRMLTNSGIRRFWIRWFDTRGDPRTHNPAPVVGRSGRTLMSLPVEILSEIVDHPVLDDLDRMRFGATCARAMSIALPVMYKYAMVRYPIKKRPLNETLKIVGHMVRELVIHVPSDVDPVRDEADFIDPFEIFDKMTGLTTLTMFFDAQVSPIELTALLRYFLKTKPRLSHITLDVIEVRHPLAAYESRTVYGVNRAIEGLRAASSSATGAKLRELSLCIQRSPADSSSDSIRNIFAGHCEDATRLRIIPHLRQGQTADLTAFRSRRVDHIQWVVRDGVTTSIYTPVLQAAANPRTITVGRVFTYANAQFVVDNMRGVADPAREYPLYNLTLLWFECVQRVPQDESFCHNPDLQRLFLERAVEMFRGAPRLASVSCVERVEDFNFEVRVFRRADGSGVIVTGRFR
ncbi:hypothetical protein TWF281_006142 [Arthrobotrys megalospora]